MLAHRHEFNVLIFNKCMEYVIFTGTLEPLCAYQPKTVLLKMINAFTPYPRVFCATIASDTQFGRLINNLVRKIDGDYEVLVITTQINCAIIFHSLIAVSIRRQFT